MNTQKTILIADDETHILNVLSIKLTNAGFNVLLAEDGAQALEMTTAHQPDLVITDYQMPHLSGIELCTRLQGDASTCGIPVVMLTARGFAITETELTSCSVRAVIDKPFSPREVLACVENILTPEPVGQASA